MVEAIENFQQQHIIDTNKLLSTFLYQHLHAYEGHNPANFAYIESN